MQALIDRYDALSAAAASSGRSGGSRPTSADRTGHADDSGEYPAGNLIADAQLADTDDAGAAAPWSRS